MQIEILNLNSAQYISISDIVKSYRKNYGVQLNLSQSLSNIPEVYLIKGRGRNSKTFLNICILDIYLNARRNICLEFKEKLLDFLKINAKAYNNSHEGFFCDILTSFLQGMFPNIETKKQFTIEHKAYDLLIGDKILIEFDEKHHIFQKENDDKKDEIAERQGYKIIRVGSNCNYGLEISKVYKVVKSILY